MEGRADMRTRVVLFGSAEYVGNLGIDGRRSKKRLMW